MLKDNDVYIIKVIKSFKLSLIYSYNEKSVNKRERR